MTDRKINMKTVLVAAAIIKKGGKILATQKGYGEFKGGWEFPGGKIEQGETPQQALQREIREELDAEVRVGSLFETVEHDYPSFHLSMQCFWCELASGEFVLKEHTAAKWLTAETILDVDWLPADIELVKKIQEALRRECEGRF